TGIRPAASAPQATARRPYRLRAGSARVAASTERRTAQQNVQAARRGLDPAHPLQESRLRVKEDLGVVAGSERGGHRRNPKPRQAVAPAYHRDPRLLDIYARIN